MRDEAFRQMVERDGSTKQVDLAEVQASLGDEPKNVRVRVWLSTAWAEASGSSLGMTMLK